VSKSNTVIGVDLGGTNVRAGIIEDNALTRHIGKNISSFAAEEVVLHEILELIDSLFTPHVSGIGIGVPSLVDVEKGIVYSVENIPSWKEVHLKEKLESKYGVPVYVNNDANCFALGEYYFGKGRGCRDIVGVTVGTGLGAGIIINGKLYCGTNCGAGEIGNFPYKEKNIEYYCSGGFFTREYSMKGDMLYEQALNNDVGALEIFREFGAHFGYAVMTVLYAFDPEIIVLGGSVSRAFLFFEKSMTDTLKKHFSYPHVLEKLRVVCSEQKENPVLGAAALVFDALK